MNQNKLYQDTDSLHLSIFNELKQIKLKIDKYPESITFKNIKNKTFDSLVKKIKILPNY